MNVKPVDAFIYHYGWVKEPKAMQAKQENFNKLWHDDQWMESHVVKADEFDYSIVDELTYFKDTHPKVMQKRIDQRNWKFEHELSMNKTSVKNRFKKFMQKHLGISLGYKNYRVI